MKKLNDQQVEEMKKLRAEGMSFSAIGRKFGVQHSTAASYIDPAHRERTNALGKLRDKKSADKIKEFKANERKEALNKLYAKKV